MIDNYPLHLPEDSTPGHCLATFSTAITVMTIELSTLVDFQMTAKFGEYWFAELKENRERYDRDDKYFQYKSIRDFSWLMNEILRYPDSDLRSFLPVGEYQFISTLRVLLDTRNRWYHDYSPHNIAELRKALNLIKYVSDKCGLLLSDDIVPIQKRVDSIANGSYVPSATVARPTTQPQSAEKAPPPMRQTAVGAPWLGPVGKRKIQLSPSGSLIDTSKAMNVTIELGDLSENRYFQLWKKLELDWLWVDSLGSVAAYVQGMLRMVGYWGPQAKEVEQDPYAKFLLPKSYAFSNGEFCDLDSQNALDLMSVGPVTKSTINRGKEMVHDGDILRVTWDGDLIHFGDGGPIYIGEVESQDWFAGHFLVPTAR